MKTKGVVLKPEFEKALLDLGFDEFTEIQEKCIPLIQQGKDVIGLSHTGSGKTVAFGFPSLEKVIPGKGIQLFVIVPTRELCVQVSKEFRKFTKYKRMNIVEVYGGVSIGPQIYNLRKADVVVGTPGRILDHYSRKTINTNNVKILVLDEADKMFEMGFVDDIKTIIEKIPKDSQKLFFGATMPFEILEIAKTYMTNPQRVKMPVYVDRSKLTQNYYEVHHNDKFSLLVHIIKNNKNGLTIIFCGTRDYVDIVNANLVKQNIKSESLHGGLSQYKRKLVIDDFHNGRLNVLVASDVAARGLDIKNVNLVINYDIPRTSVEYVHRIGRTARAGKDGKVISLLTRQDYKNFRRVLSDKSLFIHRLKIPVFDKIEFTRQKLDPRRFDLRLNLNNKSFKYKNIKKNFFRKKDDYDKKFNHSNDGYFKKHTTLKSI